MSDDFMNLPQFVEVNETKGGASNNSARLDQLRSRLNAAQFTSSVSDCSGLVSLNDILRKESLNSTEQVPEEYLMISSIYDSVADSDQTKDRQIIV